MNVKIQNSSTREYRLTLYEHEQTGWLVATSQDLPKLIIHGQTMDEIRRRAPIVITSILENDDKYVESVTLAPPAPHRPESFVTKEIVVTARYAPAA